MMKWLVAAGAIFAGSLAWAQGGMGMGGGAWMKFQDKLNPVQDYSVTMVMDMGQQAMTSKMYKLGKKMRTEMNQQGFQAISIVDPEADNGKGAAFTLMPMMKTYMKVPISADAAAKADDDKVDIKIDELGKEDVDGVSCAKRRATITLSNGKSLVIMLWTSPKAKDMPVKVEMTDPVKATIRYKDYDFTKPSADLFTLPADYKAMDMGGMMR